MVGYTDWTVVEVMIKKAPQMTNQTWSAINLCKSFNIDESRQTAAATIKPED